MPLTLAPQVFMAVLGEDVVFLDVAADAYLCVPEGREALRPSADRAAVSPMDRASAEALRAAGFISDAATPETRAVLPLPRRDLEGVAPGRLRVRELGHLLGALVDYLIHYRGRPLSHMLARVRRPTAVAHPQATTEVARLAAAFRHAAPWLPLPGKCLARSFVLLRFLQRCGHRAHWVFGVTTWPFSAHCWLQLGDLALDDAADRLALYAPILAAP